MIIAGSGATVGQSLFDGSIFEFIKRPSYVSFGMVRPTLITNGIIVNFWIGNNLIISAGRPFGDVITTEGVVRNGPKFPVDFYVQNAPALPGERLIATTSTTTVLGWCLIITEVF